MTFDEIVDDIKKLLGQHDEDAAQRLNDYQHSLHDSGTEAIDRTESMEKLQGAAKLCVTAKMVQKGSLEHITLTAQELHNVIGNAMVVGIGLAVQEEIR